MHNLKSKHSFTHDKKLNSLSLPNNKWLVNLSNAQLPAYAIDILSLGEKFNTTHLDKRTIFDYVKYIEINVHVNDINNEVREDFIDTYNKFIKNNNKRHISLEDKTIKCNLDKIKHFLKAHPNIFVTEADKGNITVVLNKTEFIQKVELALCDKNYYSEIKKSPLSKLHKNIKCLIDNWKSKGVFDTDDSFSYVSRAEIEQTNLARAYALV